jgi:uncharacterized repeat protein (TIGR01451 family)/LPXTG-motif cell wall-anchored protein
MDAGQIVNQAGVTGYPLKLPQVGAVSNQHVLAAAARPELALVKSTTSVVYDSPGDEITYELAVINTGNQTLSDVVVTDPLLGGPVCNFASIFPGAQESCRFTHRVSAVDVDAGQVTNRAVVVGTSPNQQPVRATSNEVVVPGIFRPELTLVKSTSTTTFDAPGVKIPFRFTIINTGNVTLDNVKVTDARTANVSCPKASLPMGEQMTCEATYTVTQADLDAGQIVNRAAGHGDVPGAPRLKPVPSNEVIVPGEQRPGLSMVKSANTSNPESQLPRTGRNAKALALAAAGLGAIGASMRLATRRRNTIVPELRKP